MCKEAATHSVSLTRIFLTFWFFSDVDQQIHLPFLALSKSIPNFLSPFCPYYSASISYRFNHKGFQSSFSLLLNFINSPPPLRFNQPPTLFKQTNKQAAKLDLARGASQVGVSFGWGKGGVRHWATSLLPGQLREQSKLQQVRGSGQRAGAAQRLWSWKLLSGELTREKRYWRATKPAAAESSAQRRPWGAYRTPGKE